MLRALIGLISAPVARQDVQALDAHTTSGPTPVVVENQGAFVLDDKPVSFVDTFSDDEWEVVDFPPESGGTVAQQSANRLSIEDDWEMVDSPEDSFESAVAKQSASRLSIEDDWEMVDSPAVFSQASGKTRSVDESSSDDDWVSMGSFDEPVLEPVAKPPSTKFLPSDEKLSFRLINQLGSLTNKPEDFFGFVAQNTNPYRISNFFQNLTIAATEFLRGNGLTAVERNCVHCDQAVDKTLAQFVSSESDNYQLFQVAEAGKGAFLNLTTSPTDESIVLALTPKSDTLALLKEAVLGAPPKDGETADPTANHKRACFTVSVKGRDFGHAMNYVHYDDDRSFVICGQTGTVYNLALAPDRALFDKYYGAAESDKSVRILQVLVTGTAPQNVFQPSSDARPGLSEDGFVLV